MGRPSKKETLKQVTDAAEIRELIKDLIDASEIKDLVIEDPFERYAHELKMRLQTDPKIFSSRFIRGYEVLLEQLSEEERSKRVNPSTGDDPAS